MSNIEIVFMNEARNKTKETKYDAERERLLDMARNRSELVMAYRVKRQ
jgi:hypothetical protein